MIITREPGGPSPKTVWVAGFHSGHARQFAACARRRSRVGAAGRRMADRVVTRLIGVFDAFTFVRRVIFDRSCGRTPYKSYRPRVSEWNGFVSRRPTS